ncbi:MAG: hypothetical protein AAF623_20835 [Planctomycetota bacterium]
MFRRLARDTGILIAFCGCFYLLTVIVARLDGNEDKSLDDFSKTRISADYHVRKKNWEKAANDFLDLVRQDPFNGRAWYMLGMTSYSDGYDKLQQRDKIESKRDAGQKLTEVEKTKIAQYRELGRQKLVKAREYFDSAREFARFRIDAIVRMSLIDCEFDELESALDLLDDFVDLGGVTQAGLDRYGQFGSGGTKMVSPLAQPDESTRLHKYPKFWEIVRREKDNKENR